MNFPLIVSFYTENTAYEKEAKNLVESCEKFNLKHLVQPVPSFGSWDLNCCFKPSFILHLLKNLKVDLFWTDADSVFVQDPSSFKFECDFAVRIDDDLKNTDPSKVISNSIFIKYCDQNIELLKLWENECKKALAEKNNTEVWDQVCLKEVLLNNNLNLNYHPMPKGFCKIADFEKDNIPKSDLYIVHYQASRLYKKWINQDLNEFNEIKSLNEKDLKKIRGF